MANLPAGSWTRPANVPSFTTGFELREPGNGAKPVTQVAPFSGVACFYIAAAPASRGSGLAADTP